MIYIYDLKTLEQKTPIIDQRPYFSWKIGSDGENVLQHKYQILVRNENEELLWDSGAIESREQAFIPYQGNALESRNTYSWSITVWDNYGEKASNTATFTTAFLQKSDWVARWVECPFTREAANEYKFGNAYPPVLFEKKFLLDKQVKAARAYATSHGVYHLYINGNRPDDREFAPEYTPYDRGLYYQIYDVTDQLQQGENQLSMYVADGWYFSAQASPVMEVKHEEPSVLFQIEVEYVDGSRQVIASDGGETCRTAQVIYSDLYQGEKQNFARELQSETLVKCRNYGYDMLRVQPMEPIRPIQLIPAVDVFTTPAGETIVDFGQILAGRARIHLDLPLGTEAVFEYFEILDDQGNYINTMFAPQKDTVISDGKPRNYEAMFTFHGFRYIRVTGIQDVQAKDFTAVLLSTVKENAGSFVCSDARLNRLYQNIRWSQYSNMMSIPTDCPQREKAGWTGDILIYGRTAMLNENMTPFLSSWLNTVRTNQAEDGVIMIVAPYMQLYQQPLLAAVKSFGDDKITGVAGWSDAIVWVPYDMYQITGNKQILRDNLEAMEKWSQYIIRTAREKRGYHNIPYEYDQYLWNTGFHFGEWLVPSRPDNTGEQYGICKESAVYIAPFWGQQTMEKMSEICEILGETEKAQEYQGMAEKMKYAIQEGILRRQLLPDYLMGAYVLSFAFHLVPPDLYDEYKKHLLSLIKKNHNCLDTGFLATPFLLSTLCMLGEQKLAYEILWQKQQPSWLYEVDHGATSIWEAWDADGAKHAGRYVSFNHYAFGCVDDWIFQHIAGIRSENPGFYDVNICPDADCGLTSATRTFMATPGDIQVQWDEEVLKVTIPCNMTANVVWHGRSHQVGSGSYQFS